MKFIDSVNITVIAGDGGNGCISFQRKKGKNSFLGKPDGSNGGDGGDVWLLADSNISTLNYFQGNRVFRAEHGSRGSSKNCTGKRGKDIIIKVPLGTRVRCQKTHKLLGDMINYNNKQLMVAKGGRHGLGNSHFKYYSSIRNRNNRDFTYYKTQGIAGELQHLLLELILIADVGVFGLPNSGKSSFISIISKATPKIADYPFTTLVPNLGMVHMGGYDNRFIIADIPGIIKGASIGSGLGIRFLKHLERCHMLLHFVDISPVDNSDPIENIISIEQELSNYNLALIKKTRWLVFNKIDLLDRFELEKKICHIIKSVRWKGRYYFISVINKVNVSTLCYDIMQFINHN